MGDAKRNFDVIKSKAQKEQDKRDILKEEVDKLAAIRQQYADRLKSPSHAGKQYMKINQDRPINNAGDIKKE